MPSGSASTAVVVHTVGFCLLVLLIGAMLSLLGDLIGTASHNPEATVPLLLLPQLIFGLLSVGLQPVERFPALDPTLRPQSAGIPVRLRVAGVGGRQHAAARRRGDVVGHRPGTGLDSGLDDGCDIRCTLALRLEAAMMSVASRDANEDRRIPVPGLSAMQAARVRSNARRTRPGGWFRRPGCSPSRLLRRWRRDHCDCARVAGHACCSASDIEHRSRRRDLATHRTERPVWQRPADRDGRRDVRVDGRRHRSHAGTHRRISFPVVGAARAPGIGPAVETGGRCGADRGHHRGHPVCRAGAGFPVPAGHRSRRWPGCSSRLFFGLAFTTIVITVALYAANTIVVEATEVVWGLLMFFSTGFVPLDQYPQLDTAGRPTSAGELFHRGDARTVAWRSGVGTGGRTAALVGGYRRCLRGADGNRVPKGKHARMTL